MSRSSSFPLKELKPTAITIKKLERLEKSYLKQAIKQEYEPELPPRKFKIRARRFFSDSENVVQPRKKPV